MRMRKSLIDRGAISVKLNKLKDEKLDISPEKRSGVSLNDPADLFEKYIEHDKPKKLDLDLLKDLNRSLLIDRRWANVYKNVGNKLWTTHELETFLPADLAATDLASNPLTHYCIIRNDLPRGVLAAQLIHAAGESGCGKLPQNTFAVALSTKDEDQLLRLEQKLIRADIPHKAIREPDLPWDGELMAIGIAPMERQKLRKYLSNFPLIR